MKLAALRTDLLILACAISAGIHGALVPDHLAEGAAAGIGFATATVMLAAVAIAVTRRPESAPALASAAAVLAGLLVSYVLAITPGLPVLHPEPEPITGLALATKAIETLGLLAAWSLVWRPAVAVALPPTKGT